MTLIFERTFERTLDCLVAEYATEAWRGARLEAWLFEDEAARLAAIAKFAAAGVEARLHSAYKPLVHFFLEQAATKGPFERIAITYPVHEAASEHRFLLEAYPLAGMVEGAELAFTAAQPGSGHAYDVKLIGPNCAGSHHTVYAPNRLAKDHLGEELLSPCGWLRVSHPDGRVIDEWLDTEYERLFHEAIQAIDAHDWGESDPFFETLHIAVSLPGSDRRLPVGEEAISLHEALHTDLYFSLLELFQKKAGLPLGDRTIQPGQIVPEINASDRMVSLRIETRPLTTDDAAWPTQKLHEADCPFSVADINVGLSRIGGEAFSATSRAGRQVPARYVRGTDYPIMLSGGQHPNETSGVVGALRAASLLAERENAHFTVSPLENPDGYALHWRLCRTHPHRIHWAARFTALGGDLAYRKVEPLYENAIRGKAYQRTEATLHVNLHGYGSHESTRPLSGYILRAFEGWSIPKGFFLMVWHHEGWAERARRLLESVTAKLAEVPGLIAFSARQIRLYEVHSGPLEFEVLNGIPITFTVDNSRSTPMLLGTEFPCMTIYGDSFRLAHEAQTQTVLAAYDWLQEMMRGATTT